MYNGVEYIEHTIGIIVVLVLFGTLPFLFAKQKIDSAGFALLFAIISCIFTAFAFETAPKVFLGFIHLEPLIYIFSMNIIVILMNDNVLFSYLAVKTIQITHGSPRKFFFIICTLSMFTSTVLEDVSVAIIFIPLVIRSCRILQIRPEPYIYGIALCLNIGDMFAPFSNSQNILISDAFSVDFTWFGQFVIPFVFISLLFTIIFIDLTELRKQPHPSKAQQQILLEIMDPKLVIINNKDFKANAIGFFLVVLALLIFPQTYLVAVIGAILLCFLNRKSFNSMLRKVDWSIIAIFISLFLIVGCMTINGTMSFMSTIFASITSNNILLACIFILILSSIITSIIAPGPTTLFFVPILTLMFMNVSSLDAHPDLIITAFIIGINLGGNFLPVGAPCYLQTLNIAQENHLTSITYKSMIKVGTKFSLLHILLSIGYLSLYAKILGIV